MPGGSSIIIYVKRFARLAAATALVTAGLGLANLNIATARANRETNNAAFLVSSKSAHLAGAESGDDWEVDRAASPAISETIFLGLS